MPKPARKPLVVVTGAAGGVGRLLVQRLAADDYAVAACVRDVKAAADLAAVAELVELDLTDLASIEAAAQHIATEASLRGVAALVNLAGVIVDGPLELVPAQAFRRQFEVNVVGPFALTRALLPALRLARGRVVNIGAVTARTSVPFFGPVAASKAALASLNDAMRMEFGPFGVSVALIEPGALRTEIFAKAASAQARALDEQPRDLVALYRGAMAASRAAMEKSPPDDPKVLVDAILSALSARSPKPRVLVGRGAATLAFIGRLPSGLRDGLLMNSLGIAKALRAKPAA